jgi:radical SAM superfamily enzyme YgiQ (UPF0313 family)
MKTLLTTLHSKYVHASLALPCLAAYCDRDCGDIVIEEYTVNEPKESVLAQIVDCQADVICFSVYLWNRLATLELVQCLKQINSEIKIVLGGPEVSFEDNTFFDNYPADALICGEGEIPLRHLLTAWNHRESVAPFPGIMVPGQLNSSEWSLLSSLDDIPSPFAAGLTDLNRGLVYFESSRGCPYSCSFCMSSLDKKVRSFSLERIQEDLLLLMNSQVPLIKFVDRTFNYDSYRTREIFSFILEHNISSHFHFEIGAHLLDKETLALLETVPDGIFQFEIGVQSTLPQTLDHVGRVAPLDRLAENVRYLVGKTDIHLHLDLIAGLPGENYQHFLESIDWVYALGSGHLQIEPVKLLPGAPLRKDAGRWGIQFDPNPPYTILRSNEMSFDDLEHLRGIGRLFDLLISSQRFNYLLDGLIAHFGRISLMLTDLDSYWREQGLYKQSRSLRDLYIIVDDYLTLRFCGVQFQALRELLARDYAHNERVVAGNVPAFYDIQLSDEEAGAVRRLIKEEVKSLDRSGKVQYFAAVFHHLQHKNKREILIFLYISKTASGLVVKELTL